MPTPQLPRLRLMIAAGTLHSRGRDRMDFTRYGRSGKPRMTGDEILPTLPELGALAHIEVDAGNPQDIATLKRMNQIFKAAGTAKQDVPDSAFVAEPYIKSKSIK